MKVKSDRIKIPFERWHIEEMQSYLADMSEKGLHLKELDGKTDEFETGEPERVRYRIDIAKKDYGGFKKEQLDYYRRAGWKHIGWIDGCHVYRSIAPESPSLPLDPFEPALLMKGLKRKAMRGLLMNLLLIPTAIALFFSIFFLGKSFTEINFTGVAQTGALLLILLQGWFQNMSIFHYARDLDHRLSGGGTLEENVPYDDLIRKYKNEKRAVIALTLFLFLLQAVPILEVIEMI